jgi:hypothetical protein
VALTHWFWYELEAQLPDGAVARVRLKVADLVGSLVLKGIAIGDRYVEKDAYDIYALCAHYPGAPAAVTELLRPFLGEVAVGRGLQSICGRFRSVDAKGPTWVARFLGGGERDTETRIRQDAFMTVSEVCRLLVFLDHEVSPATLPLCSFAGSPGLAEPEVHLRCRRGILTMRNERTSFPSFPNPWLLREGRREVSRFSP